MCGQHAGTSRRLSGNYRRFAAKKEHVSFFFLLFRHIFVKGARLQPFEYGMNDLLILLYEYTEILLGNRKNYADYFFTGTDKRKENLAIEFVRLVAKIFLNVQDQRAGLSIPVSLLWYMKLGPILSQINVPKHVLKDDHDAYLIAKIFDPDFDSEKWICRKFCQRINDGTLGKIPKYYLADEMAADRACMCLRNFLFEDYPQLDSFDLYRFAASKEFRSYLKEKRLSAIVYKLFTTPVRYIHCALPSDMKDPLIYKIYQAVYLVDNASGSLPEAPKEVEKSTKG